MLETLQNEATKPPTQSEPDEPEYKRNQPQRVAPVNEDADSVHWQNDRQPKNQNQSRKANDPYRDEDDHPPEERQQAFYMRFHASNYY